MNSNRVDGETIPFKIHPRAFAALGADLVTNDIVAVIELVKNSYDALAATADVGFGSDDTGPYLEIRDDGQGMDRRTIEEAWCVVATPYRKEHPYSEGPRGRRRVSGEKGLGRLSAARLGRRMDIVTKAVDEPAWHVLVDWSELAQQTDLSYCYAVLKRWKGTLPFAATGTRIRISALTSEWDDGHISDLRENLSRLVSPFSRPNDFRIRLTPPNVADGDEEREVDIQAPDFLKWPPYAIRGHVTKDGEVRAKYEHQSLSRESRRTSAVELKWSEIRKNSDAPKKLPSEAPACGPFTFEIRAWDIGTEETQEIAGRFEVRKSDVRKAIRAHKGISLYRDRVLVLPKSEDSRDWLGLDLRRVSKVGTRLSTSQIVGYVSITADENARIEDTSDREDLAQSAEVYSFKEILKAIVWLLENERDQDREKRGEDVHLHELLEGISATALIEDVRTMVDDGATTTEVVARVADFEQKLRLTRESIKTRFAYYSRLATVGTIAQMLVHEIRNRTTAIGRFLRFAKSDCSDCASADFTPRHEAATNSVNALEQLADTFAPLASRSFRRGRRSAVLEETVQQCLALVDGEIRKLAIQVSRPRSGQTIVAIDPGELETILLNIILNALYWIPQSDNDRRLDIKISRINNGQRVKIAVHDSGSGVDEKDASRIFLPGVTRKPGGIGMGLTVAAELVSEYGGAIALSRPGKLGGASFEFDVPLRK